MAQATTIVTIDDLTGEEAAENVEFSLDGVTYAIDLTGENAQRLRAGLVDFVAVARRTGGRRRPGTAVHMSTASPADTPAVPDAREIREWAAKNGVDVPPRGRLSREVREAYAASTKKRRRRARA